MGSPALIQLLIVIAASVLFAGCRTVPDADFIKTAPRREPLEFKAAWAPVSERTNAALAAELKRRNGKLGLLDRQIAIEQAITGTPLVQGNRVTLLVDGPGTYRAMFASMRAARHSINVEFYIIGDDAVGREFADILLERRAAGVQVNLIYDDVGCLDTDKAYFERLRAGGVRVVAFHPLGKVLPPKPWELNHRDHRKQVIVDGRTVFLGGINMDDVYSSGSQSTRSGSGGSESGSKKQLKEGGWRDTDIQIYGPVVADFQRLFFDTWQKQSGEPLQPAGYFPVVRPAGNMAVRAVGTSPDDRASSAYLTFLSALTHAQETAYITNAYFVPDSQLIDALLEAARRGVDVRLVLPGTTDAPAAAFAARSYYAKLLRGGVRIYERQAALLHAKTAVIDGVWSRVGSSNLDWRSAVDNDELDAIVIGREFAQAMHRAYVMDEAASDEITLEKWRERPLLNRPKEWFFRLFGRLL